VSGVLQTFSDWMNGGSAWRLAFSGGLATLGAPLVVLVHELGHAAVGLARTEGLVVVRVGAAPARWRFRAGRLQLELNPRPARNAPAGLALIHARFGVGTKVALALAGPLAGASVAALLLAAGVKLHLLLLTMIGVLGAADSLANLVPFAWHGHRSDGRYLLDALRAGRDRRTRPARGQDAEAFVQVLADTYSRWLVLYTDDRSPVRTKRRAELLSGAPAALGHASTDNPQALALWQLAFAGWCWRDAERGGDTSRLRDAALDALHQQRISGVLEPALTVRAARELATGSTELSLACPGSSDEERASFLAGGFHKLPPELGPAALPEAQQKFCVQLRRRTPRRRTRLRLGGRTAGLAQAPRR
jgi:hypothetical protein